MALIDCPECGSSVSSLAAACPKCAAPIATAPAAKAVGQQVVTTEQTAKKFKGQAAIGAVMVILGVVLWFSGDSAGVAGGIGLSLASVAGATIAIVGLGIFITARIRAWWHHG